MNMTMIVIESFLSSWLHRPAVAGFITAAANFNLAGVPAFAAMACCSRCAILTRRTMTDRRSERSSRECE